MNRIPLSKFRSNLHQLINLVAETKEPILVSRGDVDLAVIVAPDWTPSEIEREVREHTDMVEPPAAKDG